MGTNNLAESINAKLLDSKIGTHPHLTARISAIQKQMALTIARHEQSPEYGKTNWRGNEDRRKDVALQELATNLIDKRIDTMEHLTKDSKAMKGYFNSIERDLDLDLDAMIDEHLD